MQLEECMGWTLQMVTKTVAAMAQTVFCADLQDNIELFRLFLAGKVGVFNAVRGMYGLDTANGYKKPLLQWHRQFSVQTCKTTSNCRAD